MKHKTLTLFLLSFLILPLGLSAQQVAVPKESAQNSAEAKPQITPDLAEAAELAKIVQSSSAPNGAAVAPKAPAATQEKDEQNPHKHNLPVAIESRPKTAFFGRPFEIVVELPAHAVLHKKAFDNRNFEIIKQTRNQINELKITLTVISFNLGVASFPQTEWTDNQGNKYFSDAFRIETKPTKTKIKGNTIADIRPPYQPFNPWKLLIPFALIAIAVAAWQLYQKRKAPKAPPATPYEADSRPLHIIALEQIENLLMEGLWEEKHYKLFYIRLTDILRGYFEARFGVEAMRLTTRDLVKQLKADKEFKADITILDACLKEADYVKFAKLVPTVQERDIFVQKIKEIIFECKQPDAVHPSSEDVLKTDIKFMTDKISSSGSEPKIEILKSDEDFEEEMRRAEERKREDKELFLVSRQPERVIDLKVKSGLEKQGRKYGDAVDLCFNTCELYEPSSKSGNAADKEDKEGENKDDKKTQPPLI